MKGGFIEDIEVIDDLIRSKVTQPGKDDELQALIPALHRHRHSPYCHNRASQCRFGHGSTRISLEMYIEEGKNRVVYRRRKEKHLKIVPVNPTLTMKYRSSITVVRTHGGGAVAYLVQYVFKQ